jgi:prevent-host-death family protein
MKTVGIKELSEHTDELLREVQTGQAIDITNGSATIARLVPVQDSPISDEEIEAILDDLDNLAAEISARWPHGVSAQDAIDDVRR